MKYWLNSILLTTLLALLFLAAIPSVHPEAKTVSKPLSDTLRTDPETGLALDEKLVLVKAHCTSCHSSKLILQNRFTRDGWKEKIRWMQRTQNLWDLGETEPAVLDYLVKYYGPEQRAFDGRRKPMSKVAWYPL